MKKSLSQCVLCALLLFLHRPVSAHEILVLSAIEKTPPVETLGKVLRQAYLRLDIQIEIQKLPGLRALEYSNNGKLDGEVGRIAGIERKYNNLIRIDVPIQADQMYFFVKRGKEFFVDTWDSIPKDYILGYKLGILYAEYAVKQHKLKAEAVRNTKQLFQKLEAGRNDVVVTGATVASQLISQLKFKDIIRLEPHIYTSYLYHYLHSKHSDIVPKITTILKEMEARGEIKKICEQVKAEGYQ